MKDKTKVMNKLGIKKITDEDSKNNKQNCAYEYFTLQRTEVQSSSRNCASLLPLIKNNMSTRTLLMSCTTIVIRLCLFSQFYK